MRVFVTGATGFVGSAVVRELLGEGHQVLGLARSDAAAASLTAAGADVHRGDLGDPDSLRRGATEADGVIHTAFIHDFANFADAAKTDRHAVETLGEALVGSDRPLVVTSGTGLATPGHLTTEEDPADPTSPRGAAEEAALSFATRGVRASVLRLPQVHGEGDHAFIPGLIEVARKQGVSAYVDDGSNRWPAVHRLDAAHLYRLAVETAPAGARLHAVGDEGVPLRDIAEVIARHLSLPRTSISRENAADHFGWVAFLIAMDNPTSSALTQQRFGWHPARPGLIPDLEAGHYFDDDTSTS